MLQRKLYSSFKELEKDSTEFGFKIYGELDGHSNIFESVRLCDKDYVCGLVYYNHGIDPQILSLDNNANFLVGFEKNIVGLEYTTKTELIQKKSISLFYEFVETRDLIVAICELDIFVFDRRCKFIWSSGFRDIIEEHRVLNDEAITISCSNGDKFVFDLKTGKMVLE